MSDEEVLIGLIRMLPMVEALHERAFMHAQTDGSEAPAYFVQRLNQQVARAHELTGDELVATLRLEPPDDPQQVQHQRKRWLQQVAAASAELRAYIRQRIGIADASGDQSYHLAPTYSGCEFAGGVPEREDDED